MVVLGNGDTWSPYVYGPPTDFTADFNVEQLNKQHAGVCAIVSVASSSTTDPEMFWNGSALVPFASFGYPTTPFVVTPPTGALIATPSTFESWSVSVPASIIGAGQYRLRFFTNGGDGRGFYFDYPKQYTTRTVNGPRLPNPAGVTVDSNFGGTDALRLERADGTGIAGATITATVTPAGNNIVFTRGTATSDSNGRWTFPAVLQPSTTHNLTFTKPDFVFSPVTITTGVAS